MKYMFRDGPADYPRRDTLQEALNDIPLKYSKWVLNGARKGKHGRMIVGLREKKEDASDTRKDQAASS